ncbi:MAG: TlpA family protein disulfide reductase [Deinococcales bacterium]
MKKFFALGLALCCALALAQDTMIGAGDTVPDFQLWNLQKQPVSLASLRGQAVVLNFWASWCGPCRREMPELERLHTLFGEKVKIVGVNVGETRGKFEQALATTRVSYEIWYESKSALPKHSSTSVLLAQLQGTPGKGYFIPFTLMVKPDGSVFRVLEGFDPNSKDLEHAVQALVETK